MIKLNFKLPSLAGVAKRPAHVHLSQQHTDTFQRNISSGTSFFASSTDIQSFHFHYIIFFGYHRKGKGKGTMAQVMLPLALQIENISKELETSLLDSEHQLHEVILYFDAPVPKGKVYYFPLFVLE
jgi:hypothetical protein